LPNHITNIVYAAPHVLDSMMRQHTEEERIKHEEYEEERRQRFITRDGDDSKFTPDVMDMEKKFVDFNCIKPAPDNMEEGGCPGGADPVTFKHTDGTVCWYAWNSKGWGTKWNAYDQEIAEDHVQFDTAWSHPAPVIEALAAKFPDEEIRCKWADEDVGNNLGEYIIKGTEFEWVHNEDDRTQEENYEFACQIKYGMSYAEKKAEWDADEIEYARKAAFAKRIEKLRGVANGYEVIRDESLEMPQDIIDAIQTIEDTETYDEDAGVPV
jgi:hypothetical protein